MIRQAAARLAQAGVPSPLVDAELLAGHVLGFSRGEVQAKAISGASVEENDVDRFLALEQERARRVPLQHLTGRAPFRTLDLRVGPGAFIPRPETETLVELVLEQLRRLDDLGQDSPRVVDLGTGSGAIAASIAAEFPAAEIHAVEVSEEAAAWAQMNFDTLPPGSVTVTLHHCDLRDFPDLMDPEVGFDVVVSNPPYIPPDMVPQEQEVREHDPEIALYGGGSDGLDLPRAVIGTAKQILVDGGWLILEHAEVQAEALAEICRADRDLEDVQTHLDLTGRPRATSAVFAAGPAFRAGAGRAQSDAASAEPGGMGSHSAAGLGQGADVGGSAATA